MEFRSTPAGRTVLVFPPNVEQTWQHYLVTWSRTGLNISFDVLTNHFHVYVYKQQPLAEVTRDDYFNDDLYFVFYHEPINKTHRGDLVTNGVIDYVMDRLDAFDPIWVTPLKQALHDLLRFYD